jgi:hypothetical protein
MSTRKRLNEEETHEGHHDETHHHNHSEAIDHEPEPEALDDVSDLEEVSNNDMVGKIATIAVIGVGAAIISVELIPGMLIGVAAAFLPGIGPKIRPFMKSTIRAGYAAMKRTREMVAEASEQVQDVVSEARNEHTADQEKSEAAHV